MDTSSSDEQGPEKSERWFAYQRQRMVDLQLVKRGVHDPRVLTAMRDVPRHEFVPRQWQTESYDDGPLPIGFGQTISQPLTVALMAQALKLTGSERVLEVGTGSGYGAAVLSRLAREVHTVERIPELAERAAAKLAELGFTSVHVHISDGTLGLPEHAPFDAIIVTAGGEDLPPPYVEQLADRGRILIPLGRFGEGQEMMRFTLQDGRLREERLGLFAFVPLIGRFGRESDFGPELSTG